MLGIQSATRFHSASGIAAKSACIPATRSPITSVAQLLDTF
jgi:hypothetical protein